MQLKSQLPEKWAIQRTPDNYKIVNEWATKKDGYEYNERLGYIHSQSTDTDDECSLFQMNMEEGYTEINIQEFRVLVLGEKLKVSDLKENECIHVSTEEEDRQIRELLHNAGKRWLVSGDYIKNSNWGCYKSQTCYKPFTDTYADVDHYSKENYVIYPASYFINTNNTNMNTDKKVIGYKWKEEYRHCSKAATLIAGSEIFGSKDWVMDHNSGAYKKLKEAGVVELWFDKIYKKEEPKYSKGDWFTVIAPDSIEEGNGYKKDTTWKFDHMSNRDTQLVAEKMITWVDIAHVRPATPEEIKNAQIETIQMAEGFQLTIKDKKVFHKEEDITSYVIAMEKYINSNQTKRTIGTGNWSIEVKDIVFSKTGCQNKETTWNQWKAIYDKIK